MTDRIHLDRLPPGPQREELLPILLLADEPQPLGDYLQLGDRYVCRDADGAVVGATHVMPTAEAETWELRAVAVAAERQRQGWGKRMLAAVLDALGARGGRRVIVGTSNAGIGAIAFYQKAGFRLWRIERDYFTPQRGYDPDEREHGLPHRDMVWFDRELTG